MKKIEYSLLSKYRSVLMGASILSIMLFHYTNYIKSYDNYNFFFKAYNKFVSSAGVDIFLILSGLGLYYSFKKNNNWINSFSFISNIVFLVRNRNRRQNSGIDTGSNDNGCEIDLRSRSKCFC